MSGLLPAAVPEGHGWSEWSGSRSVAVGPFRKYHVDAWDELPSPNSAVNRPEPHARGLRAGTGHTVARSDPRSTGAARAGTGTGHTIGDTPATG